MEKRKALPIHHTDVSTNKWDAGANEKNLKSDQSGKFHLAYAWYDPTADDPDGDGWPDAKSAYKFIHHEVSADGSIGAANLKACSATIAVLNGGRGGANIPDADRKAVWAHVAAHLRDGDMEPPELKTMKTDMAYRSFTVDELRAVQADGENKKIVGHAAVFNELSEDLGGFREKISPGAFKKTLKEADVRALWNHDSNYVLGRNKSGTLRLQEDEKGLAIEIDPPNTTWANDLMVSIDRGDVSQMSFGFRTVKDDFEKKNDEIIRILKEVELFDVSPVTYPAYPQTDVQMRKLQDVMEHFAEPDLTVHSEKKVADVLKNRLKIRRRK